MLHCLEGKGRLTAAERTMPVRRGETVFVPACLEAELRIEADADCAFFDDSFAPVESLVDLLTRNGAAADQVERLLAPPRAVIRAE